MSADSLAVAQVVGAIHDLAACVLFVGLFVAVAIALAAFQITDWRKAKT